MGRWTVRNVEPDAIRAIQRIADTTGVGLGQALSAVVWYGADTALKELKEQNAELDPIKVLERVVSLQAHAARVLRMLYGLSTVQNEDSWNGATKIH